MDQRDLVERAGRGDHDAFSALVGATIAGLEAVARLILRDHELARDAVQDAYIKAWRDLPGLREPDRFEAWLHRLLVNTCLDTLRKRRRRPMEVELAPIAPPSVGDETGWIADRDQLERGFRRLDPDQRAVLVLHYYVGMSVPKVAETLGVPLGTAQSRLGRALATLRTTLGPEFDDRARAPPARRDRMNGNDRLERELTTWFADTAAPQTPDWTADILAATATMRQRPRWSFPARWLPAAVVPRLPRLTLTLRPVPWRTIALLALLGLLLAAAVTLYVGSRPRLPAPFGPAVNGLVAYAENRRNLDRRPGHRRSASDRDPRPAANKAPRCSRDGTRIAFLRADGRRGCARRSRSADGSGLVESKGPPFVERRHRLDRLVTGRSLGRRSGVADRTAAARTTYLVDTTTGEGPGSQHPGRRCRAVLAPARRAPADVRAEGTVDRKRLFLVDIEATDERSRYPMRTLRTTAPRRLDAGRGALRGPPLRRARTAPGHRYSIRKPERTNGCDLAFGRVSNDGTQNRRVPQFP